MTTTSQGQSHCVEEILPILKAHGLKATPQRLAVHQAMISLGHASADQVADFIKQSKSTNVTTASIYNVLYQFCELGIYSPRHSGNNKMYFDVNNFPHIHLYDKENHCYMDVMDDELLAYISGYLRKKRIKGYKFEGFELNIVARQRKKKLQ